MNKKLDGCNGMTKQGPGAILRPLGEWDVNVNVLVWLDHARKRSGGAAEEARSLDGYKEGAWCPHPLSARNC
jgi:hypothetical protein